MTLKETILQEVIILFKRNGIHYFSEADILTKLDISQATYKEMFLNKTDLVKQMVLQDIENQKTRNNLLVANAISAVDAIMTLLQNGIEDLRNMSPLYLSELQEFPEAWAVSMNHLNTYSYHQIYDIMNRGILEGNFRRDINIQLVTKIILAQIMMMLNPQDFPPEKYDLSEVFRSIYLYYFRGLCTDKGSKLAEDYFSNNPSV